MPRWTARSPRLPTAAMRWGIQGAGGVEVLIHVGVDTVEMKGDGFSPKVKEGDKVKKGQLLLEMDLAKIAAANHRRWSSRSSPTLTISRTWSWWLPAR